MDRDNKASLPRTSLGRIFSRLQRISSFQKLKQVHANAQSRFLLKRHSRHSKLFLNHHSGDLFSNHFFEKTIQNHRSFLARIPT